MTEQKQHTDYHRKVMLRRNLLDKAKLQGAFYIPFCGDGDIAAELYQKMGNKIYAADLDPERVATAKARLKGADVRQANCDAWPFRDVEDQFCLADFDAYSYPYASFRSFWKDAKVASPCVVCFTDGERQAINRTGHWTDPTGKKRHEVKVADRRKQSGLYFAKVIMPWFTEYISPWTIKETFKYLRGPNMLYWGAILERTDGAQVSKVEADTDDQRIKKVEDSLYEAALSGNVTAIQLYLSNKAPEKWAIKPGESVERDALRGKRIDPLKLAESFRRKR